MPPGSVNVVMERGDMPETPVTPAEGTEVPPRVQRCLNCGEVATENFCPACGQETAPAPQNIVDFLRGRIARYVTREGQLRQTIVKLLWQPGALTTEYLAGRRARYLRPFQLYLMVSVIVFGAVQVFGLNLNLRLYGERGVHVLHSARPADQAGQGAEIQLSPVRIVQDHVDLPGVRRFAALSPQERFAFLRARRAPYVSYFVLFLVPFFALILGVFYRLQRRPFADHLVFGLHGQAFLLTMLLVGSALPALLANALSLWVISYFVIALKRVYRGSWVASIGRGVVVLTLYFAIFFVANLLLVLALLAL
jgi:hypothetical protein